MSVIEVESLLTELSAEAPAGADVEYDPEYFELEKLARGTQESAIGDVTKPAEEADWKAVKGAALKLSERTRDLRVASILAVSLLKEDGIAGFRDGAAVVKGLLERMWDKVYPKLDPDDNNDPTIRVNVLKGFVGDGKETADTAEDLYKTKLRLREAVLTNSQQRIGKFCFRDIQIARGEVAAPVAKEGEPPPQVPTTDLINAAFADTLTEDLQATQTAIQETLDLMNGIDSTLGEKIGPGTGPDVKPLTEVLEQMRGALDEQLAKRGIGEVAADGGGEGAGGGGPMPGRGGGGAISGEISSRADVIRMLDKINAYYEQYEPTSPVPIFMNRAKRLVTMNFVDLIKDLAPEAMAKIEVFTGEPAAGT